MTTLLEQAIEVARELSPEEQNEIARTIFMLVAEQGEEPFQLTEDDRAAIERSRAAAARGDFASDEEVEALFAKYRR